MSVKERLERYIDFKGIKKSDFCKEINVSGAFISSMRVSIQPDKLKSIALKYPDLNTEWLLTGNGEMLKSGNINTVTGNGNTSVAGDGNQITTTNISEMIELQKGYQDMLKTSQAQITSLISIIEKLS